MYYLYFMNENSILTREEYIANARRSYEYFLEQAMFFKKIIDGTNLSHPANEQLYIPSLEQYRVTRKTRRGRHGGLTVPQMAIQCIEDEKRPLSTGELMSIMSQRRGKEFSNSSNFGTQLRTSMGANPKLKRQEIDGRYYWGVDTMFSGDHFKDDYMQMIIAQNES